MLQPFAFAANGFTVEYLNVGDNRDFGSAAEGLAAAGMISVDAVAAAIEEDAPTIVVTPPMSSKKPLQK
ncbi:MAG: hypothetical protein ACT6U0_26965, partial [Shinella sp.]